MKNQGSWVQQYIESLSKIYVKTKDTRFNLIITDFESFDVKLEEILKKSQLPHWQVLSLHWEGNFSLWISLVNVTKCAVSCGSGHICWRKFLKENLIFCAELSYFKVQSRGVLRLSAINASLVFFITTLFNNKYILFIQKFAWKPL